MAKANVPPAKPSKGEAAQVKREAGKKMDAQQWEKSATDKKMDRAVAAKSGQSVAKYEGSKTDQKNDKAQLAAHNAKAAKK